MSGQSALFPKCGQGIVRIRCSAEMPTGIKLENWIPEDYYPMGNGSRVVSEGEAFL